MVVTQAININVPATVSAIAGLPGLSSLSGLPARLAVADGHSGANITVQLIAANPAATMAVANAFGAGVSMSANTLTLSGSLSEVNAALAALQISEPSGVAADTISILAEDNQGGYAVSGFALSLAPQTGPAFVNPVKLVTLAPNQPLGLPYLLAADPAASALAAMGLGAEETLQLTLSLNAGVLLLPEYDPNSGISAQGIGTGTIQLTLSANEIGLLNSLLTSLEFAGPSLASGQHLTYALWNHDGVLPRAVTSGNIYLNTVGPAAAPGTFQLGGETLMTGPETISGTLDVTGLLSVMGNLAGGAVSIAPGADLELPYNNSAQLSGTSYDFGTIGVEDVLVSGQLMLGGAALLRGELALNPSALADFSGSLNVDTGAQNDYAEGLSLGAGAVLEGGGTLAVGDFSESGMIDGTGTILALQGETLEIDAGLVAAGVNLDVAGGGVMVLGPDDSLFGIFDTTPLTVQSGVTLNFLGAGSAPITGQWADPLGGTGGAFVIKGPADFSGTVTGFGLGDELIFPGLTGLSVHNINTLAGSSSFVVSGTDENGLPQSYTLFANIPAGLMPAASFDAGGDADVVLHGYSPAISYYGGFAASAGVAQPVPGLSLVLAAPTTMSLTLTLSAAHGKLTTGAQTPAGSIILTAPNLAAMNADLAMVSYIGTGMLDVITVSSGTGTLAGLHSLVSGVAIGHAGTVNGYSGGGFTEAELISFGSSGSLYNATTPYAVGGVLVAGQVEFNDDLFASGMSGTAMQVDGGGNAVFGGAGSVSLQGGVTLGDASGAGALEVLTDSASIAGNLVMASAGGSGASLAVMGGLSVSGAILAGAGGAAAVYETGTLTASALTVGASGTLDAYGAATATLGSISNSGSMTLAGSAALTAASYVGSGTLEVGGLAGMSVSGQAQLLAGGSLTVGVDAALRAGDFIQSGGTLTDAGQISASGTILLQNGSLAGGSLQAGLVQAAGTLTGQGVIAAGQLLNSGVVEASGGRLLLSAGSIGGQASLQINGFSSLEISTNNFVGVPVGFAGGSALLVLDDVGAGLSGITGMTDYDAVDLVGVASGLVSLQSGGEVVVLNNQGATIAQFGIQTLGSAKASLQVGADGNGGALITLGGELPCFARGTRLLTPDGYRLVETLRPGDPLITARGERRPVRWIGWRTLDLAAGVARMGQPVIISPGAFGPGKPARTLRLSPLHCVHAGGVLIPVSHLVNGATIRRDEAAPAMTYYHVELDRHEILLAEGLDCESYFCSGNRAGLSHELGRRSPAARPYAPTVTSGARLAAVRRRLHETALAAGFAAGYVPRLRAVAAGQSALPEISLQSGRRYANFYFARPVPGLTLLCPATAPADTDPDSEDRRELGLCLGAARGLRPGAGWLPRAPGDAGLWMGARADIAFAAPRRQVRLPIAALPLSWLPRAGAAIDAPRPKS